jgi:hypothetical protein
MNSTDERWMAALQLDALKALLADSSGPLATPFPGRTADNLNDPDFQLEVTLAAQNLEVKLAVEEGLRQIRALHEAELAAKDKVIQGQMDRIEHKDKEIATPKRKLGEAEQPDLSVGTSIAIHDSMPVPSEPKRHKRAPKTHKAMEEDE